VILVRREHLNKIQHLSKSTVATGIGNVIGNKGGVGVAFYFNDTPLMFVTCHLAAHQKKVADRNTNYRDIMKSFSSKFAPDPFSIHSGFHHIFWCGDLNYRVDHPREEVLNLIREGNYLGLLNVDQLKRERDNQNCFIGFNEGPINFPPTYRYNRGDRTYSEHKQRIPSWCDRILWRSLPGHEVTQTNYNCCDLIVTSDHSPVFATFKVPTQLPPIPPTGEYSGCKIYLSDIKIMDIASGEKYDLHISIFSSILENVTSISQSCIRATGNTFYWKNEAFVPLQPIIIDKNYLESQHVVLMIKNRITYRIKDKEFKRDEELGQVVVTLKYACGDKPSNFNERVVDKCGDTVGRLTGSVHVIWELAKPSNIIHRGFLIKKGLTRRNWRRRFFTVSSRGEISYYETPNDVKPLNTFMVLRCVQTEHQGKKNVLSIETPTRNFLVCADNETEYETWFKVINEVCSTRSFY
jgi:phosphatidylinositol-3,4,5-trisphosphate 5-phosphatase 2